MSESSAYRNQAWGGCYAGTEGGDLALSLEFTELYNTVTTSPRMIFCLVSPHVVARMNTRHSAHLPTNVKLDPISHLHLPKAIVRHVQGLNRLVPQEHVPERLGAGRAHGVLGSIELQRGKDR